MSVSVEYLDAAISSAKSIEARASRLVNVLKDQKLSSIDLASEIAHDIEEELHEIIIFLWELDELDNDWVYGIG